MSDSEIFNFRAIGRVSSPFRQKFGTPRQSGLIQGVPGEIILDPVFVPTGSLEGLSDFSHIWVVFSFHLNQKVLNKGKVSPPRLLGRKQGVLATRSPHRPNSIGLSLVELKKVDPENMRLVIAGHDLTDGTPVLDVKPYIPDYDRPESPSRGWLPEVPEQDMDVIWSPLAQEKVSQLEMSSASQKWIEESLSADIRSRYDRRRGDKDFYWHFMDYDLRFRCEERSLTIEDIVKKI